MNFEKLDLYYFFKEANGLLNNNEGIGAVSLITPTQMLNVFNVDKIDSKNDGNVFFAAGTHQKTREKLIELIYGIDYSENIAYADNDSRRGLTSRIVEVRYVNSKSLKLISITIPAFISKLQYHCLVKLSDELKKIQSLSDFYITILVTNNGLNPNDCIVDSQPIFWDEKLNNLDDALEFYKKNIKDIDFSSFPKGEKKLNFKDINRNIAFK